jgi:hypothetical protein
MHWRAITFHKCKYLVYLPVQVLVQVVWDPKYFEGALIKWIPMNCHRLVFVFKARSYEAYGRTNEWLYTTCLGFLQICCSYHFFIVSYPGWIVKKKKTNNIRWIKQIIISLCRINVVSTNYERTFQIYMELLRDMIYVMIYMPACPRMKMLFEFNE